MSGEIVFTSDRQWVGDPRFGSYVMYLDGRRAGVLRPRDRVAIPCESGPHRIRVRQWYYLSPTLDVNVAENESVVVQADLQDRQRSFLRRMATLMFRPWRGLSLQVVRTRDVVS